jgi:hypothetical protein
LAEGGKRLDIGEIYHHHHQEQQQQQHHHHIATLNVVIN